MPKRILRVHNRLIVGGPARNVTLLSKHLAPEYETLLVVGAKEEHETDSHHWAEALGLEVHTLQEMVRPISPMKDWRAYQAMKKIIADFKPDIVHTHAAKSGAIGRLAAAACGVPVIVHTFHGHVFHSYFNAAGSRFFLEVEKQLAKKTDAIVAISERQLHELRDVYQVAKASQFAMIPLGLDLDPFTIDQSNKRNAFRTAFNCTDETIAIGIVGRMVGVKDHATFIRALQLVLQKTTIPIKAFIVGDGDTRAAMQQLATECTIPYSTEKDNSHPHPLVFTSWRSDIDVLNAGFDIAALSSLNEGTPVSLIEAAAAAKPCVSTKVGGVENVVVDQVTGALTPPGDASAFAHALLMLINDADKRHRWGLAAQERVLEKYSYQRLVSDMDALYQKLLHQKR